MLETECASPEAGIAFLDPEFLDAVRDGLSRTPKTLPCRYFYDFAGSQLFEQICDLPEYYLTRCEDAILRERSSEIVASLPGEARWSVVELGSGSSRKTRHLLSAFLQRQSSLRYVPVDISAQMLDETATTLRHEYPRLEVSPLADEYFAAMSRLQRSGPHPMLVVFLGSNLGNFEPGEARRFLNGVRGMMESEDRFLIGLDLKKDRATLEAAYDDAQGVTAAFNLNLLKRINRELGGDFRLERFQHRAYYNEALGRVEMHLVSRERQRVRVAGRSYAFEAGESIHTENSHKYDPAEIRTVACEVGLAPEKTWRDADGRFSLNILKSVAP